MTALQQAAFDLFQSDSEDGRWARNWFEGEIKDRLAHEGWRETRETAVFMIALSFALENFKAIKNGGANSFARQLAACIEAAREYDLNCISLNEALKESADFWTARFRNILAEDLP